MTDENSTATDGENGSSEGSSATTDYLATFDEGALSEDAAMEALLGASTEDAEKPSKDEGEKKASKSEKSEEETADDEDEDDETDDETEQEDEKEEEQDPEDDEDDDEDDDAEEDDDEDEDSSAPKVAEDDAIIEFKVDGEVQQASVSDLKRLAGQEAKLTQKSQAVSAKAKEAKAQSDFALDVIGQLYDASKERLKRYEGIDLVELAQSGNYSKEDLNQVRADMEDASKEVSFFEQGLKGFVAKQDETKQERLLQEANDAVTVIEDVTSDFHIDGFKERYPAILQHGRDRGIPEEFLQETPSPWLWKLLSDSEASSTVTKRLEEKTEGKDGKKTAKTEKSGKQVLKSKKARRSKRGTTKNPKSKQLIERASRTGTDADALNALMSL